MSPLFRRRTGAANPGLAGFVPDSDERVLAAARAPAGPVIATTRRLVLPVGGSVETVPVSWDRIERASWDRENGHLVVVETAAAGSSARRHLVDLPDEAQRLLDVIREQVNATVVLSRYALVNQTGGVRVSGRRRPGHGELVWTVTPDRDVDMNDPDVRVRVDGFVARVRAEVE